MKAVVLVHGSHCGGWAWERVTPILDAAGVTWVAPDLPSVALGTPGIGHIEDAAAVDAVLDALPGSETSVLVGHSRGGGVISNAGTHARVGHLVYVTAVLLDEDEPSPASDAWRAQLIQNADGSSTIDPSGSAELALNDCSAEDAAWYMGGVRRQRAGPLPEGRYVALQAIHVRDLHARRGDLAGATAVHGRARDLGGGVGRGALPHGEPARPDRGSVDRAREVVRLPLMRRSGRLV